MQFVRRLLAEQRKRAVASVLSAVENATEGRLSEAEQRELRRTIVAAVNQYHDTTLDVLKSSVNDGMAVNEDALRVIAEANRHLGALRRSTDG